jgi:hypothetical protein
VALLNRSLYQPSTATAIEALDLHAQRVADRWASGWRRATRQLEISGRLLPLVREQAAREIAALAAARASPANAHLADHEILALYDIDPAPPLPSANET